MDAIKPGTTRAAVVIGVDKTNGLKALKGAASGALDMKDWLEAEGYHTTAHVDVGDAFVARADIFKTVDAYAKFATLEKLVIYFAGHGYYSSGSEVWLLSGAPNDQSEAINLRMSEINARMTKLTHVIFIADTCRSLPLTFDAQQVQGAGIFPNKPSGGTCEVDTFFATLAGDPALEVAVDEAMSDYKGLFTEALKNIHKSAREGDLVDTQVDGKAVKVFPNRKLKKRLPEFFSQVLKQKEIKKRQSPSLRIESDEPVHLARGALAPPPSPGLEGFRKTMVAPKAFSRATASKTIEAAARDLVKLDKIPDAPSTRIPGADRTKLGLAAEARAQVAEERFSHFETRSGATIAGSGIAEALAIGPQCIELESESNGAVKLRFGNALGDYSPLERPFSALIRFTEGTGTIIAALPGYVAALRVQGGALLNVSYMPAHGTPRWDRGVSKRDQTQNRRAMAAVAARHGVLALDREDAKAFADAVRVEKAEDPTLGLYASLAYAGVGLRKEAKSVLFYSQRDTEATLFDAWLLAGGGRADLSKRYPRVPVCPMLSQSWDYLAPYGVQLPTMLSSAPRVPALWTTFRAEAMDQLLDAARKETLI